MKNLWKVWFSPNRGTYIRIAIKLRTTPWKVYRLGHGGRSRSKKEAKILEELKKENIISHIRPW